MQIPGKGEKPKSPWVILVCAWLMGFAIYTPMFSVPPIMHIIREELLLSHAQIGLVFSVPLIMLAAFAIPSGVLADRIGIRNAAGIGVIVLITGSLLRGTATGFAPLLAFTCLYGTGLGMVLPNLPKLVGTWFPPERRGLATGIYVTGIATGGAAALSITLPVVFPISNTFQGVLYLWTLPAVIAAVIWWAVLKEPPRRNGQRKQTCESNQPAHRIWTDKPTWLVAILLFIENFTFYTWVGWTPELMMVKGASPELAALMGSSLLWVGLFTVFLMPWASDKIGLRRPFLCGAFMLLSLGALNAIYVPLSAGWAIVVAAGIGTGTVFALILALPPELVPIECVGRASGIILSIGYTGGLLGPWLGGYIIDITGTFSSHLAVLIGLAVAAAYIAFRLPETGPKARQ